MQTIGDILNVLPRAARRQTERILSHPQDVRAAAKLLHPILTPHAKLLMDRTGNLAEFLCYALPFYSWNPGGDIYDFLAQVEAQAKAGQIEVERLEREIKALQQILNTTPEHN